MAKQRCPGWRVLPLALAGAVTCALGMLIMGLGAEFLDWGVEVRDLISKIYIGSAKGLAGIFIGMLWAFADAFIALLVFGWLYNVFVGKPKTES